MPYKPYRTLRQALLIEGLWLCWRQSKDFLVGFTVMAVVCVVTWLLWP